ncbi:ATP-binding cassette domain-containing protein [Aquimarina sp. ERC-38]|uniref:ABC transporter ATP-binding protein n=1 Tax=Aquimarina sp. ERC-38 TaxID=2949996 RepID=UPI0022477ECA|nr:ATP-binding cassette domain-containing protein [Aquimarina sp. ERC-38]UZO80911.1 ATP-binding cassette domain-containing protein [Aquimarina sp. ERC-38]
MNYLLDIQSARKQYGNYVALNDVSIQIPEGSIFGLLGPNGAGKTTLIRIINQITMPDQGAVLFNGEPLSPIHIKEIGYLPEERGLYKTMKVGEQALYLAQLKGLSKKEAKNRLKYWFDKFEITHWWDKKIQELSKGMAQKVQFIVTVLHKPKLLIFDEPFSGFDPINANLIKDEILLLQKEGATVIFSTHRMESVEELCDTIALIHKSNKILDGKVTDIKRTYKSNTFEIGLNTEDQDMVYIQLKDRFTVEKATFKTIDDLLKLKVTLSEGTSSNELIQLLSTKGQVQHFTEVIPSINDIFIQTISSHE